MSTQLLGAHETRLAMIETEFPGGSTRTAHGCGPRRTPGCASSD